MVRPDLAGKKIARATAWLDDAENFLSQTSDAFVAHGYALLDHRRLHTDARSGLLDLRRFLVTVADAAGI